MPRCEKTGFLQLGKKAQISCALTAQKIIKVRNSKDRFSHNEAHKASTHVAARLSATVRLIPVSWIWSQWITYESTDEPPNILSADAVLSLSEKCTVMSWS